MRSLALIILLPLTVESITSVMQANSSPPEGDVSLFVELDGMLCCQGAYRLALYNREDAWMNPGAMLRGRVGVVIDSFQVVEIHGLPAGEYAVAVFQDLNGDGKLNRRLGLVPKEPYGFSNNTGRHGPASFKRASFILNEHRRIRISLHTTR